MYECLYFVCEYEAVAYVCLVFKRTGSRWRVRDLTYRISKYPSGLKRSDVDREIAIAFKVSLFIIPTIKKSEF